MDSCASDIADSDRSRAKLKKRKLVSLPGEESMIQRVAKPAFLTIEEIEESGVYQPVLERNNLKVFRI